MTSIYGDGCSDAYLVPLPIKVHNIIIVSVSVIILPFAAAYSYATNRYLYYKAENVKNAVAMSRRYYI